jgi:hypothetical protein
MKNYFDQHIKKTPTEVQSYRIYKFINKVMTLVHNVSMIEYT